MGRLRSVLVACTAALALAAPPSGAVDDPLPAITTCAQDRSDRIHTRAIQELRAWAAWLRQQQVPGLMGEMAWPGGNRYDAPRWACLADHYYDELDAAGLAATPWMTGEQAAGHTLAIYEPSGGNHAPVDQRNVQAEVVEGHLTPGVWRGINVAGGELGFGADKASASAADRNRGEYGVTYGYPSAATYTFLASRGLKLARLPVRWERIQPRRMGPLDVTELARLRRSVRAGEAAGLTVLIDLHNYAGYFEAGSSGTITRLNLGTPELPIAHFADVWRRISLEFRRDRSVMYGLMNEPIAIPAQGVLPPGMVWEKASRAAVDAIRANGDGAWIAVGGYGWSGLQNWLRLHRRAWIRDPLRRVMYEGHHYWDHDYSARYTLTYEAELAVRQVRP